MTVPEITVKSEFDGLMAEAATNIEDMISVNIDDSEPDDRMTQASVMPVARAMKPVVAKADAFLLDDLESAECESDDCIRTQPGMAGTSAVLLKLEVGAATSATPSLASQGPRKSGTKSCGGRTAKINRIGAPAVQVRRRPALLFR